MGVLFVVVLILGFLYFYVFVITEDSPKRLAKDISKDIVYKLERDEYFKGNRTYARQYDKLSLVLQYVGYSYKEVFVFYNKRKIAEWTICKDGTLMEFVYYEKLFNNNTLAPFFRED